MRRARGTTRREPAGPVADSIRDASANARSEYGLGDRSEGNPPPGGRAIRRHRDEWGPLPNVGVSPGLYTCRTVGFTLYCELSSCRYSASDFTVNSRGGSSRPRYLTK